MLKHNLQERLHALLVTPLLIALIAAVPLPAGAQQTEKDASAEARLKQTAAYLASDDLEGRAVGSKGIDLAADYIAAQFKQLGLKTDLFDGKPFQTFPLNFRSEKRALNVNWKAVVGKAAKPVTDSAAPKQPAAQPQPADSAKNVLAMLEGQGTLANETILIGAHYDHLGKRREKDGSTSIYNGANDNASGVAIMLEVARILATRQKKLPRRIVFAAFSAEERGLVGSFYYVHQPLVPLDTTIAMISLDMIGRPDGNALAAAGRQSSPALADLVNRIAAEHQLTLADLPSKFTGSDHLPFYGERIPAIHFMTIGGFTDFHRPSDDSDKLDIPWMRRVADMMADLTITLAETPQRPKFIESQATDIFLRNAVHLWGSLTSPTPAPKQTPPGAKGPKQ